MRKKNFWAGIGILTVCAALGLGGCQRENQCKLSNNLQ